MLEAANQRTLSLLHTCAKNVAAQLSPQQRESVFQAALAHELQAHPPTHTEFLCPVLYTTLQGKQTVLATERIDIESARISTFTTKHASLRHQGA